MTVVAPRRRRHAEARELISRSFGMTFEPAADRTIIDDRDVPLARLTVLASEAEIGNLERDGLWLIAVGALIVGLSLFVQGPQRGLTGRPVGAVSTHRDRFLFAAGLAGALLVALGSVLLMIGTFPDLWVVIASLAGVAIAVYTIGVLEVRRDTRRQLADAQRMTGSDAYRDWHLRSAQRQARWRWWLRHPFLSWARAREDCERELGPPPMS